jgi:carbamoyl-phosphate synthase large subunit
MSKIKVIITGTGGGGIGEQIIKALRNGRNSYHIISTDTKWNSTGRCLGDDFFVLPSAGDELFIENLISLCRQNDCKILIPGSEPELMKISRFIYLFEQASVYVPINQEHIINMCLDKLRFQEFLSSNGFNVCKTCVIDKDFKINELKNFPYIIKPIKGSGSKNVFIAQDQGQLSNLLEYLKDEGKIMIQEYVGSEDQEYTVGVLSSPQGYIKHIILKRDLSFGMSVRQRVRNRTNKAIFGEYLTISTGISQGKFILNELIDDEVIKFVRLLGVRSTLNMQCRIHRDKVYIFEINPRFSGTTNLRALVGFNEPEYLINEHLAIKNPILNEKTWINRTILRGIQEYAIL